MYPDTVTFSTSKVPDWEEFDRRESTERFRIRRRFHPLPNWKYAQLPKALPRLIDTAGTIISGDYACLHCGDLFPQAFNGIFLRKIFRLPLIIFCHGDEISQTDKRRYQPKVRDIIYRNADAIIAANQFAYEGLVHIGIPKARIHKLTPGVDLEHFQPGPCNPEMIEQYGLAGKKVVLTVARLVPRKGHKIVLQALPTVLRKIPNLKYLIAGEGPEKARLEEIVGELDLGKVVTFLGDVSHQKIREFYNLCDAFIMVNRLDAEGDVESFGMVFTEANAMGKPVIGGRSGGALEAVLEGETGFLVDPDSTKEVAERLLVLLTGKELSARMGSAGLKRVQADFNWKSRAHTLRQISAELVRKWRTGVRSPVDIDVLPEN